MAESILEVRDLTTVFHTDRGDMNAVEGVSFHVERGEILGLVGESGCGKSVTSQSVLRLYDEAREVSYRGQVLFEGRDLLKLSEKEMRAVRGGEIAMVFQDSLSSLNPVLTCGDQIMETMRIHQRLSRREAREKAVEMLGLVGIPSPEKRIDQYPHELSGGRRQRVMIACALSCRPRLLIADEPTTALDVTIQAQVLNLMRDLKDKLGTALLLITHDFGVVAEICDKCAVMYAGEIVESGEIEQIFNNPSHPYTLGLFAYLPSLEVDVDRLEPIPGLMCDPMDLPSWCSFYDRCSKRCDACKEGDPPVVEIEPGHIVKCRLAAGEAEK